MMKFAAIVIMAMAALLAFWLMSQGTRGLIAMVLVITIIFIGQKTDAIP